MSPNELPKPSREDGHAKGLDQLRNQDSSGAGVLGSRLPNPSINDTVNIWQHGHLQQLDVRVSDEAQEPAVFAEKQPATETQHDPKENQLGLARRLFFVRVAGRLAHG